ncbi:SH3 domain-containing protein (plasmid) [Streptomyces phaeochromogenes]|uniref:SH3 domain-containing protein n=1 Tax=Streptomyces phaeochromogenes TaxID=1923 RepID=UPI0038681903|nr:SH3 domain-containing protein [Streptomyces phaeochromogenes]
MRRKITTAVLGATTLTLTSLLGAAPATANSCGYEVTSTVHLRSGPGTSYKSWGLLRKGDSVTNPSKKQGSWWKVEPTIEPQSGLSIDRDGWVNKRYLKPSVCMQLD